MTVAAILDTRYNRIDNRFPIRIRITHNGKQDYYATGIYKTIDEWHKEKHKDQFLQILASMSTLVVYDVRGIFEAKTKSIAPNSPGIYFLFDAAMKLVYIGSTKNICDRVKSHIHRKAKEFTHASWINMAGRAEQEISTAENIFIKIFMPKYNRLIKI